MRLTGVLVGAVVRPVGKPRSVCPQLQRYVPNCSHARMGLPVGNDVRVQLVDDLLHGFAARARHGLAPRLFEVGDCMTAPLGPPMSPERAAREPTPIRVASASRRRDP